MYGGALLCSVLGKKVSSDLNRDKQYRVCWDIQRQINMKLKESEANTPKVSSFQPIVSLKRVRAAVGNDEIIDIDMQGRRKRRKKAEVVEQKS